MAEPQTIEMKAPDEEVRGRFMALAADVASQDRARVLDAMRTIVEEHPAWTEGLGCLAWALAHEGLHEEAISLYRRFEALDPSNLEIRWRMADRLVNLGRIDEAEEQYRQVVATDASCEDAAMGIRYVQFLKRRGGNAARPSASKRCDGSEWSLPQRANKSLNDREFERGALRMESLPHRLYLESTLKCNFLCRTCTKGYEPYYAEDLRGDIFEKVRAEVLPTVVRMSITGFGEPTMAADFEKILGAGIDNGTLVHFVTNASLLNFERIEKLTSYPVDITISFDGATKETFESVRQGSNFNLVLEKLAMIRKLRDIHLSQVHSNFAFNFVALRRNIRELPDVVRIAHRYGIRSVGVADYSFNGNEFDAESPRYEPAVANAALAEARRVASELGISLNTPPDYLPVPPPARSESLFNKLRRHRRIFPARDRFPSKCSSPWTEPYIHTDGRITPCCASGQHLGDMRERDFHSIWNGWRYRLLRLRIHSPIPPLGCRTCFVAWGINGGNAGNALAKEGLLVKGWYWLEWRFVGLSARVSAVSRKLRRTKEAPLAPNFYRGRPMTERNRPGAIPAAAAKPE